VYDEKGGRRSYADIQRAASQEIKIEPRGMIHSLAIVKDSCLSLG